MAINHQSIHSDRLIPLTLQSTLSISIGGSSPRSSDPTTGPPVTEGPGLGRNRPVPQEMVSALDRPARGSK